MSLLLGSVFAFNESQVSIHRQRTTPDYVERKNLQISSQPRPSRHNSPLCADPEIEHCIHVLITSSPRHSHLLYSQQMLEVREQDVGTLLQVKSLDPDQTLGDGGDEVPAEAHHAAEIQIDQEPSHQG